MWHEKVYTFVPECRELKLLFVKKKITTMTLKCGAASYKQLLLVLLGFLFCNQAEAQLDSVSVSNVSFSQEVISDSLTNITDTVDIMAVDVYIDDIDFMGEVLVTVYDLENNFPLSFVKHTKAELLSYSLINGSVATLELLGLEPTVNSYKIDVQVRNFQGANFSLVSTQY